MKIQLNALELTTIIEKYVESFGHDIATLYLNGAEKLIVIEVQPKSKPKEPCSQLDLLNGCKDH
jgi:hypothetical protein